MMKKITVLAIILICLGIAGFFIAKQQALLISKNLLYQKITPVPAPMVAEKIKGCWEIQDINKLVATELDHLKKIGINTITFSPQLDQTKNSDVRESPLAEIITKIAINKLHSAGIRVMLEPSPMGPEAAPKASDLKKFQDRMKGITLRYAEIAEKYQVEYFSPLSESEHHMGIEAAEQWMQEILPEVRKRYKGKIMWKKTGADLSLAESKQLRHDINFSGYDYIVLDVFREGTDPTLQEHKEYIQTLIENTKVQAKADGVPQVILGEFGGTILPVTHEPGRYLGDYQKKQSRPMTNKELAETTRAVLELAENMVDGYIYSSCSMEGRGITVIPEVEEVIKEWYNSH